MAGQHQNNFTISGINPTNNSISGPITSNFATILVNGRVSATLNKSIIVNGTAQSSTTLAVGQTALFRLTYNNTSNTSVNDVRFIDLLPMNQANTDGFILSRNVNRGSNVNLKLSNVLGCAIIHLDNTRTTATPQIFTDASTNIHLQEIGIIPSTNTGINVPVWQQPLSVSNFPTARNVKWEFSNITVGAGEAIECEFEAQTPASISGTTAAACNTFVASATGNYTINGVTHTLDMIPIESPPACLTITPPCNCAANTPLSTAVTSGSSSSVWTCGKTYSVTCDKGYDYTANYKCNGNCTPTFTYQITNNATGAVVTSGATASFHFAILASGTYTLTWIANCGGTQCVTCSYLIKVSCANSCVCDVKQNILVSYSPTDPIATSNTISCGKSIKGKCGQKMKFGATYTCTPTSCASRIEYTITRTSAGFTPVIGTTSSFSYTFSGNGTYDITWVAYCNNVICQKCVTTVIIEDCATPCVCCKESEILIKSEAGEVNIANHSTVGNYLNYANVLSITTTRPFVELSADVIDFQIRAKESGCKPICMKPFLSATPSASSILGISPLYSDGTAMTNPANQQDANPRELIWKFSTPVTLTNETVKFTFALPIGADISCCEATAYLCIKLRFKDEKCNVCEQTYCVEVPITQLVGNKKPIPALKKK